MSDRTPRLDHFRDPDNLFGWLALQRVQMDSQRERYINLKFPVRDTSGVCGACGRPFDDHRLTYSAEDYPNRLCPKTKVPVEMPFDPYV